MLTIVVGGCCVEMADLFKNLSLKWPQSWVEFVEKVASVFNFTLPRWLSFINVECSFQLAYFEKFCLVMASPFLLMATMVLGLLLRTAISKLAIRRLASIAEDDQLEQPLLGNDNQHVGESPTDQPQPEPEAELSEVSANRMFPDLFPQLIYGPCSEVLRTSRRLYATVTRVRSVYFLAVA